ncbi:hypothetical protein LWE61_14945 [Sphingobium sufflavum]|uniref:hypothetical protein n=1 Tax=Sphingobium sufflavum TaxID=1129547 RepID=UPI001F28D452|nr:hypothetical protein [Sphingobium sufflavum]MCE7797847.1 hypothetical protein [Sphingobium sufflavum]
MELRESVWLWFLCIVATSTVIGGKLGAVFWGLAAEPPSDPAEFSRWQRRRRWSAYSEISALPAFATIGVVAVYYGALNPIAAVPISMTLGAVGFPLLLHGAQLLYRDRLKRLGISLPGEEASGA